MASYLGYDYCFAATNRYLESPTDADSLLADGRKCVDASVENVVKDNAHYFDDSLPSVYEEMAEILNERGGVSVGFRIHQRISIEESR